MTTDHTLPSGQSSRTWDLTGNTLKLIACCAMLCDHAGYVLLANNQTMRHIGRIAFPLFIFFLIEGFFYTRNARKYMLRLLVFGLASELPFDLALYHVPHYWDKSNVMWTLLLGFLCMYALDSLWNKQRLPQYDPHAFFLEPLVLVGCFFAAEALHTDYHAVGVLAIVVGFSLRRISQSMSGSGMLSRHTGTDSHAGNFPGQVVLARCIEYAAICTVLVLNGRWELYSFLALPLIALYRGRQGQKNKLLQYGFYAFYPVHLVGIYLVYRYLHFP